MNDLFRGFNWNRIQKGNRKKLGVMYFDFVKNEGSVVSLPLGKTAQNQQQYKKL